MHHPAACTATSASASSVASTATSAAGSGSAFELVAQARAVDQLHDEVARVVIGSGRRQVRVEECDQVGMVEPGEQLGLRPATSVVVGLSGGEDS